MPNVFARENNDITDERIAHILSEASNLMKSSHNQDHETRSNEDSKSPNRGQVTILDVYWRAAGATAYGPHTVVNQRLLDYNFHI